MEFADRLYFQARNIVTTHTLIGVLIGVAAGGLISKGTGIWIIVGAAIAGAIAYQIGQAKAFALKLQAQTALCQVKIEENTRKS